MLSVTLRIVRKRGKKVTINNLDEGRTLILKFIADFSVRLDEWRGGQVHKNGKLVAIFDYHGHLYSRNGKFLDIYHRTRRQIVECHLRDFAQRCHVSFLTIAANDDGSFVMEFAKRKTAEKFCAAVLTIPSDAYVKRPHDKDVWQVIGPPILEPSDPGKSC